MGGEPHALCPEEGGAVILAQGAPSDGLPIFGEERDLREKNMRRGKHSSFRTAALLEARRLALPRGV